MVCWHAERWQRSLGRAAETIWHHLRNDEVAREYRQKGPCGCESRQCRTPTRDTRYDEKQAWLSAQIEEILEKTTYQKRVWTRLGNKYLDNDNKQMRQNGEAARMREWLIPGSTQGRRRVRSRNNQHGALEPGTPGGAGIQEPRQTQDVQTTEDIRD